MSAAGTRLFKVPEEFNEQRWVWVPDAKQGYLAGWVIKEDEDLAAAEVRMRGSDETRTVPFAALFKMNPPRFDEVEDIADLTFLNEASVVHNLGLRYYANNIYTYSGLFLVAINPYRSLPLYSDVIVRQYRGKRRNDNPPHIFAIAERAWINMVEERENQSILITGESGAGKTESTKKVIQYFAAIALDAPPPTSTPTHSRSNSSLVRTSAPASQMKSKARLGFLEHQIIQANPILEAFGNAQTQRNNNSSRFGKFVRVMFGSDGSIAGANIDWYLLEKSRVVVRDKQERCFHIFYQLLAGGAEIKEQLLLEGEAEDYEFLSKSNRVVPGMDDGAEWKALKTALDLVGLDYTEQFDLFRVVAAILHIGNIVITSSRGDDAQMPDTSHAEKVCHLLGLSMADFTRAILRPRALAGREWVTQTRTRQQALDELGALSKTLYEKTFGALVDRLNRALDRPASKSAFIGVLDIAGFEIFDINGYEQLLINYTNEKLQQFFNHHMFVLEQEEYGREGIPWDYVNFGLDLQPTIDLIEANGNTIGILCCLDEECIMPKASDLTFTNKLNALWSGNHHDEENDHPGREKYEPARFDQGFRIQHYAAKVEYRTDGWLEKNKDPLNDDLAKVLATSKEPSIVSLFTAYADLPGLGSNPLLAGKKRTMKKGAFRTVAQRHKEQLSNLMSQLKATQPHFIRCIVPNQAKRSGVIDVPLVLDQLRCNGVLEGIRIARLGFPNRLPFIEFRQRYEILTPGIIPKGYMDGREATRRIVNALELDDSIFKIGTSKIFFKAGVLAELEERRDALLYTIFTHVQAAARMWSARRQIKKILNRAVAIRTLQRNARVYGTLKKWAWWQLYTKIRPLLAATRNDEELRRKEMELALAKERAERDLREKEVLEALKARLQAEKNQVELDLDAERALVVEKHAQLQTSLAKNVELEEEISDLKQEMELLDTHLDTALKLRKESEEKREMLRQAFDEAADHLIRLQDEQKKWTMKEGEVSEKLREAEIDIEELRDAINALQMEKNNLAQRVVELEEDLERTKERTEDSVASLTARLGAAQESRELLRDKLDSVEHDAQRAKDQADELTRTVSQYAKSIEKKEAQIANLEEQIEASKQEREREARKAMELRSKYDALQVELEGEVREHARDVNAKEKMQRELDELRELLETKVSEETRRREVERSRELELANLRRDYDSTHQELVQLRKSALEQERQLELEKDVVKREYNSLERSHKSLLDRERTAQSQLTKLQEQLPSLEQTVRSLTKELSTAKSQSNDTAMELAEVTKDKEELKRQLATLQSMSENLEDEVRTAQRERDASNRALENLRESLESEANKRTQLEKLAAANKVEIATLKEQKEQLDKEISKALADLEIREREVKQTKSNKTIVEHVHVLEQAKRLTDQQLMEARLELKEKESVIRSLRSAGTKMSSDIEYMVAKYEAELRTVVKQQKDQQESVTQAIATAEKERKAREEESLQVERLLLDVQHFKRSNEELEQQYAVAKKAKESLEVELERLAQGAETNSSAKQEKSQSAMVVQERTRHLEIKEARAKASQYQKERNHLRDEVKALREKVEVAKTEAKASKRALQQATESSQASFSVAQTEAKVMLENYKVQVQSLENRLKSAETAKEMAEKDQKHVRQMFADFEIAQAASIAKLREATESAEERVRELESQANQRQDISATEQTLRRQMSKELQAARDQHKKAMAERESEMESLRAKYQGKLDDLTGELQHQREHLNQMVHEKRELRSENDDLQNRYDKERYESTAWKKEKERMEIKIRELERTNEASTGAQAEQQSQIVKLHSQVRDLRAALDEVNNERSVLQKARVALREELESIKLDHRDTSKPTSEKDIQRLQLENRELERSLEEQEDHVKKVTLRMQKAEEKANSYKIELGKVQVENSRLDKLNATLEEEIKKLNVRIVDLQGRSYIKAPRPSLPTQRPEDMSGPVSTKDIQSALDSTPSKIRSYEDQVQRMRSRVDGLEEQTADLESSKRRLEAESLEYKRQVQNLERELERTKARTPGVASTRTPQPHTPTRR